MTEITINDAQKKTELELALDRIKELEAELSCGHAGCEDELIVTCHTHIGEDYPCARCDGKDAPPEDPISPPDPLVQHDDPISPREAF